MGPGVPLSGAAKQAEILRKDGNHYFQKGRIGAAIEAYTEKVEEDCRRAIQLDSSSVKVLLLRYIL
ncbi:E3 ubiquitin-protein ligase CHIP [Cucumis melo var. makuwa]|uniref:E3 ubiquitin-protein ligase CHIP n=1 Tax=Cucumis melo var. makuwa TaxID=1194695 RepID=A0A5D3DQW1_CUCMM|nr:E3 ubiquitin-protein ligase CHIP [Cucumis melo var. makuwa]